MKFLKTYFVFFLGIALAVSACKKDEEESPLSREEMLTGNGSKSWKITGAEGNLLNDDLSAFTIDFYNNNKIYSGGQEIPSAWIPAELKDIPSFPDCAKDNIIVFKDDYTYETNEGATSCNTPSEFLLTKGTWTLSANEEVLILNDNSGTKFEYNLTTITNQTISGENSGSFEVDGTAVDYTLVTTFTAQ